MVPKCDLGFGIHLLTKRMQPSHQCMEQWDTLHAMLILEMADLGTCLLIEGDQWKHELRVKGLQSPFLLKVRPILLFSIMTPRVVIWLFIQMARLMSIFSSVTDGTELPPTLSCNSEP